MCKEVVLVPSDNVTGIDYFPIGWILCHHWLNLSNFLVNLESSMTWCKLGVITELH